ncbi:MAG: hypothetical protein ACREHG_05570, partial [Candidatus Saccharimonadales bacterium]
PTGFFRDGINMTAAKINPRGNVSGDVSATGCNIGVYYDNGSGSVNGANIHGSNYFGVLVNGDVNSVTVNVENSSIHNIGETPLNGDQHGVAVYYRAFGSGTASGKISNNNISVYQKGGIVVNGAGTTTDVRDNTVTGQGPVNYIAQNGIQVGYGAVAQVMGNTVTGNSYTGPNFAASGGILVVGGDCYGGAYTTDTQIVKNSVSGNDIGIWLSNLQGDCVSAPTTQTNIKVVNNVISNSSLNNTTGNGTTQGYQAGIADQGNNDKLINNKVSGAGYDPANSSSSIFTTWIDASSSFTNNAKVHANKTD